MQPDLIAGRYRVVRVIARGGMGTLWLCRDEVLTRLVAVKQVHGLPGGDQAAAARSIREARLAAALNHENAVSVYDVVGEDGTTWIVMEYVPSRSLAEVMRTEGPLPPTRVAWIGAQVAAALATAHALGIVHRDVKPSNILVGERDVAKITDFGIARGDADEHLTLTGFITGTPAYFAPELARGENPSPASDVWALGATLYAAVEGTPPYGTDRSPLSLLGRIAAQPPPRPIRAGVLTPVLESMLARDRGRRASMEAARRSLSARADDVDSARAAQRGRAYDDTTLRELPISRAAVDGTPTKAIVGPSAAPAAAPPIDGETTVPWRRPRGDGHGRPGPALLVVGLSLLLVLVLGGALMWGSLRSPDDLGTTAQSPQVPHHTTASSRQVEGARQGGAPTTGSKPSSTTTTSPPPSTPSTTVPSRTPTATTPAPPSRPPSSDAAGFVTSYFATVPGDLNRGWHELAPSMRSRLGRESYEDFWGSISSVDVAHVRRVGDSAVEYEITYHFKDGRVVLEDQRIDLQPHGNRFWILGDTVLSSTTLRS